MAALRCFLKCFCCCSCALVLAVCSVALFLFSIVIGTKGQYLDFGEDIALSKRFNDGSCELLAQDLIRGGNSLALWRDGIAIVSAGDLNTTFRHNSRGARGAGLFAVDLRVEPKPVVRRLEILDWPETLPPLVGQGLFLSNASGRLYVVNHGAAAEEVAEELHYEVGEEVQAICASCTYAKWWRATVKADLGGGTYEVTWNGTESVSEVLTARQLRKLVVSGRHEEPFFHTDISCPRDPLTQTFFDEHSDHGAVPVTYEDCVARVASEQALADLGLSLAEPFVQYLEDEPPGCFAFKGVLYYNANKKGVRRAGRVRFCKTVDLWYPNEEKNAIGLGREEEGPESFVEVFEILGDDFGSLRLRHVDHIGSDAFPYQGISQVAEGRNASELFVLRELPWRSDPYEHNLVQGSRNVDPITSWSASSWYWYWHWLGFPSLGRNGAWTTRNGKKLTGIRRYSDSPGGGDVALLRCKRLESRPLEDEGVPVRGGLRWNCAKTLKGLPATRGLTIHPNRSEVLLGHGTRVARYKIQLDGELVEVGVPISFSLHGWIAGLSWEEPGRVQYAIQPAPSLMPFYRLRFLRRPGVPAELAEGEPPDNGDNRWIRNFMAPFRTPTEQVDPLLRHDGSLLGGHISSWVLYGSAVLAGSDYEEGLLYCRSAKPLVRQNFSAGDRVWVQVAPAASAHKEHDRKVVQGVIAGSVALGKESNGSVMVAQPHRRMQYDGARLGYEVVARHNPHRIEWRMATVVSHVNTSGQNSYTVQWDTAPKGKPVSTEPIGRLQAMPAATRWPLRRGERVEALDPSSGGWAKATIAEEHGDGNVSVLWDEDFEAWWNLRRRDTERDIFVRFALPPLIHAGGAEAACAGDCIADDGSAFGPRPGGRSFGWLPARGGGGASEGSCSAEYAGSGECASPADDDRPSQVWELVVPEGYYKVSFVLRSGASGGAAERNCTVEGRAVEGSGVVPVHVADGRLTLGGCRDMLESISVHRLSTEEALAKPFYFGAIGQAVVVGHFEQHTSMSLPDQRFLVRLPAGLVAENVSFVATIRGGSCGERASVLFRVDDATLRYFQHGVQAGWRPLHGVRRLRGGHVTHLPTRIWTGSPGNDGWILTAGGSHLTFASGYRTNANFEYCNGLPLTGGETVMLSFLAGPPPSTGGDGEGAADQSEPLKAGDRVMAYKIVDGAAQFSDVVVQSRSADGTYAVKREEPDAKDRRRVLPLEHIRRTEEAGYRRIDISVAPQLCLGPSSWTPMAQNINDCLRLCSARPLCRFAAFYPTLPWDRLKQGDGFVNCVLSANCSERVPAGSNYGSFNVLYEKLLDPIDR